MITPTNAIHRRVEQRCLQEVGPGGLVLRFQRFQGVGVVFQLHRLSGACVSAVMNVVCAFVATCGNDLNWYTGKEFFKNIFNLVFGLCICLHSDNI